ncbi:hypothetical protein MCELHM10_04110 [Paracoccaceae bacterium]|jgi:hypothetical protein
MCAQMHFVRLDDGKICEHSAQFLSRHMTALPGLLEQVGVRGRVNHAMPGGLTMNDGQVIPYATESLITM